MTKIFKPINGHCEVLPVKFERFIASTQASYEEKGQVLSIANEVTKVNVGDVVFFDAWLVARYPDADGKERYLVKEEDIRAVERDEPPLPAF